MGTSIQNLLKNGWSELQLWDLTLLIKTIWYVDQWKGCNFFSAMNICFYYQNIQNYRSIYFWTVTYPLETFSANIFALAFNWSRSKNVWNFSSIVNNMVKCHYASVVECELKQHRSVIRQMYKYSMLFGCCLYLNHSFKTDYNSWKACEKYSQIYSKINVENKVEILKVEIDNIWS